MDMLNKQLKIGCFNLFEAAGLEVEATVHNGGIDVAIRNLG